PLNTINKTQFKYIDADVTNENAAEFLKDNSSYYGIVWIPENVMENPDVPIYSFSQVPMDLKNDISSQIRNKIENIKRKAIIEEADVPDLEEKLAAARTPVTTRTLVVRETGETKESSSEIASIMGIVAGFVIYMFIFMYASQVMKGVIEEKSNRIVEVLVSSVKSFQFLLGKIIGVASVGLVQFLIWIVLGGIAIIGLQAALLPNLDLEALREGANLTAMAETASLDVEQLKVIQNLAQTIDTQFVVTFLGVFIFYFIGGYLLYASLFAAIGAAVDNETDSQQFLTPFTIILVVAIYIGIAAMKSPDSSLVVWSSIIPFTSSIVMLVRIPFGVPTWELILSMVVLVGSFILFTWLSSKIYRIGILMYGKKVNWKDLYKWLKY
ncbi:MAG: ABC transporter permease, partial [Odoribacter sp.]|nr:ABC transporter permease [Odoribacter sp.]